MLRKTSKNLVKNVLSFTKVKLLYTRITLTRYTAVFFWAALINFIIGVVFQGISLQDHLIGDHVVSTIFQTANLNETTMGLPLLVGNTIRVCDGVPGVEGTSCNSMPVTHGPADNTDLLAAALLSHNSSATLGSRTTSGCSSLLSKRDSSLDSARPVFDDNGKLVGVTPDGQILLDLPCITSFVWLAEMLRDAKREDIATLTFQIWLLTLAVVTILNESLPHLGTVLIGHVLLTGWAAFRICESFRLKSIYETAIVGGPCRNFDPMGNWWDVRLSHAIPMVVMNGLALLVMGGLSIKLFRVYAKQTFSRVGATAEIHHLYKLVLFLSACLQLTGFFTLVSAAIWIDKIGYGPARPFVEHFPVYLAGFIVTAVFTIPWLVLGWTSVRRERRKGLIAFFGLSFVMLSIAIAMFASPIYRFVFDRWPFFATMTVTSFVLMLATAFIGALCGRNFGKGLAQYLNVTDALEGEDFTPVMFSTEDSEKGSLYDDEKNYGFDNLSPRPAKKSSLIMARPTLPSLVSSARPNSSVYDGSQTKILSPTPAFLRDVESGPLSPPAAHQRKNSAPVPRTLRKNSVHKRGASDYDDYTFGMPTLSYQNAQPTSRNVKGNSPTSAKSTVSEFPPVLPPMPILEPLTRPRSTVKVGLPANPRRSRTLSSTSPSRSPSDSKPGYF